MMRVPSEGALDFLSLGALVHRLDPGVVPFRKATECTIHVSGGEFNTAANLSDGFGLKTAVATAMVDYPIGDLISERVRAMGVRPFYKRFAHDGVRGPNMATVYSDRGHGVRGPVVFYNRSNEAAALLKPGDFDWDAIFAGGVRWFHSGGIFASLSPTTSELIVEAMRAAKAHGAVVSFDLNYRDRLWTAAGGRTRAQQILSGIVSHVDVLVGNEEDLQHGLGIPGPEDRGHLRTRPPRLRRDDRPCDREVSRRSRSSRRPCAKCTRPTVTRGARWPGSTDRPTPHRPASSMSTTVWAAATASRPGCSTACSAASRRSRPSGSAGRTARC